MTEKNKVEHQNLSIWNAFHHTCPQSSYAHRAFLHGPLQLSYTPGFTVGWQYESSMIIVWLFSKRRWTHLWFKIRSPAPHAAEHSERVASQLKFHFFCYLDPYLCMRIQFLLYLAMVVAVFEFDLRFLGRQTIRRWNDLFIVRLNANARSESFPITNLIAFTPITHFPYVVRMELWRRFIQWLGVRILNQIWIGIMILFPRKYLQRISVNKNTIPWCDLCFRRITSTVKSNLILRAKLELTLSIVVFVPVYSSVTPP